MLKSSVSLPSIIPHKNPKLFDKQQLKQTQINLKKRFQNNQSDQGNDDQLSKRKRSLMQFPKGYLNNEASSKKQDNLIKSGFFSFKDLNKNHTDEIISSISRIRAKSTNLDKQTLAQVMLNKKSFKDIEQFCINRIQSQKKQFLNKLKCLQPLPTNKVHIIRPPKPTQKQYQIKLSINYHIYQTNRSRSKPYIQYDSMNFSLDNKAYWVSGRKHNDVVIYDRTDNIWITVKFEGIKPFGQSCPTILTQHEVIFFGGIRFYQPGISQIVNFIQILNIDTKINKTIKFNQQQVVPRAYHAQCIYGQFLIISGGIDSNYKTLSDFKIYNYVKNYWNSLDIAELPMQLQKGISKHKMQAVLHKRKRYMIYQSSPIIQQQEIKQQGIYIFGGEDNNVILSSKLYLLRLGRTVPQIVQIKSKGVQPNARKNFSMIRFRNYLVIHGGRNDQSSPFTLNTIHFFHLKFYQWKQVQGDKYIGRYSHGLMNYNHQEVMIFGGKNDQGLSKELYSLTVQEV